MLHWIPALIPHISDLTARWGLTPVEIHYKINICQFTTHVEPSMEIARSLMSYYERHICAIDILYISLCTLNINCIVWIQLSTGLLIRIYGICCAPQYYWWSDNKTLAPLFNKLLTHISILPIRLFTVSVRSGVFRHNRDSVGTRGLYRHNKTSLLA